MLFAALAAMLGWVAPDTPPDPFEPPLPRPMTVETVRDPITDDLRVQATLRDQDRRLTLACDPHDFEFIRVTFTSNRWLVRGNFITRERPLIYRFDDNRPVRLVWIVKDREARLAGRKRVGDFLQGFVDADEVVFRTRDVETNRLLLRFRIVGAREAVDQLLRQCGELDLRARVLNAPPSQ